ncbi:YbcC family protein [Deefgea piscis]|uniref:YbcC family protein n=1 Tax=Deefgea piscis TaxID=2739061 RepID=UPI001C809750|nr:DUF2309 domain-containing protein [Deefgea piscis]QZA82345.1 DUF2309 domain-containing protein [Deefgea piscis]
MSKANHSTQLGSVRATALLACERIAPAWPLDQSMAVNPWWKMRDLPMSAVAAKLQALGGVHLLMPKSYYRAQWQTEIKDSHLAKAAQELGLVASETALVAYLAMPERHTHWLNVCDLLDADPRHQHKMPWRDEIVQQISQFTALYFQYPEHMQQQVDVDNHFYQGWLEVIRQDEGIEVLMGESGLNAQFAHLPEQADALLAQVHAAMFAQGLPESVFVDYCYALLLDMHGWASWLAYGAWQDAFEGKSNTLLLQLLAVRMAWDWALWTQTQSRDTKQFAQLQRQFGLQLQQSAQLEQSWYATQQYLWVWQRALEYAYQQPLHEQLVRCEATPVQNQQLQAIFCIDVRSEPMRRALEAQSPAIQTLGFAGFFGLPIEYSVSGSQYTRPQLPGLLKASIRVEQTGSAKSRQSVAGGLHGQVAEKQTGDAAPATFGIVEAKGLYRAVNLVKNTFFPGTAVHSINQIDLEGPWTLSSHGRELTDAELAKMAAGILGAMGLKSDFAPAVLLVGHGSSSTNNPHAAGLDCGACGGQSGEVNVKVLAQVLNTAGVRAELSVLGIHIPTQTQFVAALHNTTTDKFVCFGVEGSYLWQSWLRQATAQAQKARALSVGITNEDAKVLDRLFQQRAKDWAQIRPEWGLANNAAFIVAPRAMTQRLDLAGRSFLHDYKYQEDTGFSVLELIMTAPMVVTNWINLQYYASVTDNLKYGSGNKLLHNVVGGNYGVFEGNGGDLRVGLSMQSIHDGENWRHHPLRLSVYIAAPRDAIEAIIVKHQAVADLIQNQWLFLFQWDTDLKQIWQYSAGQWQLVHAEREVECVL